MLPARDDVVSGIGDSVSFATSREAFIEHRQDPRPAGVPSVIPARCPRRGFSVDDGDVVADRDGATGKDVGPNAAAIDERPKQTGTCELLEVRAGFGEPPANAGRGSDAESMTDEPVQRDAGRDDVAASILPRELDGVEHVCFNKRDFVAAAGPTERASSFRVAVALKSSPGQRSDRFDSPEWRLGLRSYED